MNNNARNDLIAYHKVLGYTCNECADILGITIGRVWLYWRLISINIIYGDYDPAYDARNLKLNREHLTGKS